MRGLHEGQSYEVNGIKYLILHYIDGTEFSKQYVQLKIAKQYSDVQITGTKDMPEETEKANRQFAEQGLQQVHATIGETDFTFTQNGKAMRGICFTRTDQWGSGKIGSIWQAFPSVVTAPADKINEAVTVLRRMVTTSKDDPQWTARQNQITQQFNQMVMQNHEQVMQQLHNQYEKFSRQLDKSAPVDQYHQWRDGRGEHLTGESFKAAAGHNYYFQRGDQIVGNGTGNLPDINFTPLKQLP